MTTISKHSISNRSSSSLSSYIKSRIGWILILSIQFILILYLYTSSSPSITHQELTFHGGNPLQIQSGSCHCNSQPYCLCTPSLAIDAILISPTNPTRVYLVKRKDTNTLATMGGFVQVGETVEDAVMRELMEETNDGLELMKDSSATMELLGVYSDPRRDARRHTVSVAYVVPVQEKHPATKNEKLRGDAAVIMKGGDDVKDIISMDLKEIKMNSHLFFSDHWVIFMDYYKQLLQKDGGGGEDEDGRYDGTFTADQKGGYEKMNTPLFRPARGGTNNLPLGEKDHVVRSTCFLH